jgi:hypothetical protein
MLSFLGLSGSKIGNNNNQDNRNTRLGDLTGDKNIGEQLNELRGKVEKTMTKNKSELQKYKELSKFNEKLSKSYLANLKVITDISALLKAYNEFFEMFKTKLSELDDELDSPLSQQDFDVMKKLTTEQLVQLEETFRGETAYLKKLYSQFGRREDYDKVETAEKLYDEIKTTGIETFKKIAETENTTAMTGGKTKRGARKVVSKTDKKKIKNKYPINRKFD